MRICFCDDEASTRSQFERMAGRLGGAKRGSGRASAV